MRRDWVLALIPLAVLVPPARPALAGPTEERADGLALGAVRRAGGAAEKVTSRDMDPRAWELIVDSRWWVWIRPETGQAVTVYDHGFEKSPHQQHRLTRQPGSADIEQAGRELLHRVYPDLDMTEMQLEYAKPRVEAARVEARWRQMLLESGFPGPGHCLVDFCWPDKAIFRIRAETPPVPHQWRQTPAVTKEQAVEIAQASFGDLRGGWLEATRDLCVWDDANPPRPAWNVALRVGTRGDTASRYPERSVFVDPWTGEAFFTALWMGGRGRPGTVPRSDQPGCSATRSHSWLPWAGGGAAVLAIALGAAMVCLRRRRA